MGEVYAVGVGPGSPRYITDAVKEVILYSEVVIGYKYTLKTIERLLSNKEVYEITMQSQEEVYQRVAQTLGDKTCVIPFTGDVNFSESEVVDRLFEIFGKVQIIPGVSSIQVAAARACIPLDKSRVITMHISTSIENEKLELQKALLDGLSVILVPRPWPNDPAQNFMPSEISLYLKDHGFETTKLKAHVFEFLTTENEKTFDGTLKDLEGRRFSDLCVLVINQYEPKSYIHLDKN